MAATRTKKSSLDPSTCKHEIIFGDRLCGICGAILPYNYNPSQLVKLSRDVSVAPSLAEACRNDTTCAFLAKKKLTLLVDLDNTLIHATFKLDSTEDKDKYFNFKVVGQSRITYYVKER